MCVIIDLFAMFLISNFLFIAQNLNSKSNSKHFQTKHMDTSNQVYYTHISFYHNNLIQDRNIPRNQCKIWIFKNPAGNYRLSLPLRRLSQKAL